MSTSRTYLDTVSRLRAAGCVFAEDEARLLLEDDISPDLLDAMVRRRIAGEPLEHILGWVRFCDRRVGVESGVFVPRRRTEFLVACATVLAPASILDMCCGSGAVGLCLGSNVGAEQVIAVDIDDAAVRCARHNLQPIGGRAYRGDLYDAVPPHLRGSFDVIVVNAPYVPTEEIDLMPREARLHEPLVALDGGTDGVDVHRRVATGAKAWLAPGGHLLVETSECQSSATAAGLKDAGLTTRIESSDEYGAVVVIGS